MDTNNTNQPAPEKKAKKKYPHILVAEHLMSFAELAAAAGMTPQGLRNHIEHFKAKGLESIAIEGGDTKYLASSWNKIIHKAQEEDSPL